MGCGGFGQKGSSPFFPALAQNSEVNLGGTVTSK